MIIKLFMSTKIMDIEEHRYENQKNQEKRKSKNQFKILVIWFSFICAKCENQNLDFFWGMLIHLIHLENQSFVSILVFPLKKIKRYTVFMISCRSCTSHALALAIIWWTASFVGSAGIAPIPVTVIAPQPFAKRRASFNFFSLCQTKAKLTLIVWSDHAFFNNTLLVTKLTVHWCLVYKRYTD